MQPGNAAQAGISRRTAGREDTNEAIELSEVNRSSAVNHGNGTVSQTPAHSARPETGYALTDVGPEIASERHESPPRHVPPLSATPQDQGQTRDHRPPEHRRRHDAFEEAIRPDAPNETPIQGFWRNRDYFEHVQQLLPKFPQLETVLRRSSQKIRSADPAVISITDKSDTGTINYDLFIHETATEAENLLELRKLDGLLSVRYIDNLGHLRNVRHRFIMVHDLNPACIRGFGEGLDIEPEFFAEHLHKTSYGRPGSRFFTASEMNQPYVPSGRPPGSLYPTESKLSLEELGGPSQWNTSALRKSYCNLTWYRPVRLIGLPPSLRTREPGQGSHWEYPDRLAPSFPNLFRPHWRLSALSDSVDRSGLDISNNDQEFAAWEERLSVYEVLKGDCKISKHWSPQYLQS